MADKRESEVYRALANPLRVRILELMESQGEMSPKQIARELRIPLGNISYHVNELRKTHMIELTEERSVRGAAQHFYRVVSGRSMGQIDWLALPLELRNDLLGPSYTRFAALASGAIAFADSPEGGLELTWFPVLIDPLGCNEVLGAARAFRAAAREAEKASMDRSGKDILRTMIAGVAAFEKHNPGESDLTEPK